MKKLNDLPIDSYIKFTAAHNGQSQVWFAQKQTGADQLFYQVGDKPIWKDVIHENVEFQQKQIPANFEVVSETEVKIAQIEHKIELNRETYKEFGEFYDEAANAKYNAKMADLEKELAQLKAEQLQGAQKDNMGKLHNIYLIANEEAYKSFMQDEWKQNDLHWYSSIDRKKEYAYEDLQKRLPSKNGNMYFRVVENSTNGCKEICIHSSKAAAIKDVKEYPSMNVDGNDTKIVQPNRIERAEDLAIALQCSTERFEKAMKENGYTEYELKAARAISRYGSEWHKHVNDTQPIGKGKASFEDKVKEAKALKAQRATEQKETTNRSDRER